MTLIHGTSIALDGRGVLLRGPSGSGKSDLALRLLESGARLVADDQTELTREGEGVIMSAPAPIAGRIEAWGLGIVEVPALGAAKLALVVDLVPRERLERLPEPQSCQILGAIFPLLALCPFDASASAKLKLAVKVLIP
ncbi:MAG TPA: serine/threonine protein kinase [Stellaceae bacterium]|nr:serine/threonine protein kinase [Stellaceae bacterium]